MGELKDAFKKAGEEAGKVIDRMTEEIKKASGSNDDGDDGQPQKEKSHAEDLRRYEQAISKLDPPIENNKSEEDVKGLG